MKPQAAGARGQVSPPPAENKMSMWVWAPGHLRPALERTGLCRPGRAPGTIPSCIICKYCEVKPPPPQGPSGVRALPGRTPQRSPPSCVSVPSSDTVTVSLQASTVAKAGPLSQAPGVKALGLLTPRNPSVGARGERREGLTPSHCWKGINSPKVSPCPLPRLGFRGFCSEPPPPRPHEWASGGTLGRGGPQGKAKGFSGNPHILSLKFPTRMVPWPDPLGSPSPLSPLSKGKEAQGSTS